MSETWTEATVRSRVLAYLADAVVVGSVLAVWEARGRSSEGSVASSLAVSVLVAFPYHVLCEGGNGQTPGKKMLGIAVTKEDGDPCTYRSAAIRTAFRFVDWLPVAYLVGLASIALTERSQRLGDVAASTVVVRTDGRPDRTR